MYFHFSEILHFYRKYKNTRDMAELVKNQEFMLKMPKILKIENF